jgi:glyoxylase-like metal-dependent hydrolase (beta-lactamase superfamily II)
MTRHGAGGFVPPAPAIVRVLAPNPGIYTLEGTNTWVVGRDPAIVIDPGPDHTGHLVEVERTARVVGAILLTHGHPDHAPGAEPLASATGAKIFAFRPPADGEHLRDGQVIHVGETSLTAVHTPGHTPDHVVFLLEERRALFTGDAVLGRGTSVIDPPEGELAAYLRSLRRMLELDARTIYPGHGPVVFDARAKLEEYVAHREERERQVLEALGEGPRTTEDLAGVVYPELDDGLRPLAARSMLAHVVKLEAEGRADHSGHGDAATYSLAEPRACERCGRPVRGRRSKLCSRCSLAVLQETPEE